MERGTKLFLLIRVGSRASDSPDTRELGLQIDWRFVQTPAVEFSAR